MERLSKRVSTSALHGISIRKGDQTAKCHPKTSFVVAERIQEELGSYPSSQDRGGNYHMYNSDGSGREFSGRQAKSLLIAAPSVALSSLKDIRFWIMSSSEPSSSRASSPEPPKKPSKTSSAKTGKSREIVEKKKKRKLPEHSSESEPDDDEEVKGGSSVVDDDGVASGSDDDGNSEGDSGSEAGDEDGDDKADDKMEEDDTPALSHAERRRRKKAEKRAAVAATADEETGSPKKKRKLADGSAETAGGKKDKKGKKEEDPAKVSRKNSVWVGNLSFKTTTDDLKRFFSAAGEVTRVNMPTKAGNIRGTFENRGYVAPRLTRFSEAYGVNSFAYVDFATDTEQTIAIGLSEQPLLGRKLLIKNGTSPMRRCFMSNAIYIGNDFAGRPAAPEVSISDPAIAAKTHTKTAQKILRAQKQPPCVTLFFGNLGFQTTEGSLREMLEAHQQSNTKTKGKKKEEADDSEEEEEEKVTKKADPFIRKVRLGTFEDSGKCKGQVLFLF